MTGILAAMMFVSPAYVFAEDDTGAEKWDAGIAVYSKLFPDCEECNFVRSGGVNSLDGISAETRSETQALESHLLENDYVLASTPQRRISDEDVKMLESICWIGTDFINDDPFLTDGRHFKVYIYSPTLRTAQKQWRENHALDFHVQWEITVSSVLVNYYMYDELDKMGKTFSVEELNENLPIQYQENAGFVEFSCPIDAEIKLLAADHEYYYHLYLRKGKTLVKMRGDHYELVEINGHDVARGDIALTNGNYFVVWQQTEEEPLQVEFSQLVKRDDIGGIDLTGKPDCRWGVVFEDVDVKDEGDVTVDNDDFRNIRIDLVREPYVKDYSKIIASGILVVIIGILAVIILINRKKR
jgi:hypothetical protein